MICRPWRSELVLVFMKATDACILVGKVEFILAHSPGIFCNSDVFDNFAQVTLTPQRVRGATHCTRMLLALNVIQPRHRHASIQALLHSCTFRIWYLRWSLIAMATSDFSCSLGPVLSLSNQNKTFVKIPSGSTYSTHYDELTLTLK